MHEKIRFGIIGAGAIVRESHVPATKKLAEAGKHVLCEKPMATNLKDAKEMVKACRKNKVKLQIGFNQRFWNQVKIAQIIY